MTSDLTVIVGGFFGDEGKGKITAYLAQKKNIDAAVRAGVGPNAGHTVVYEGETYKLRLTPSGFMVKNAKMYIGPGVLINPNVLFDEMERTRTKSRLFVDYQTGVITNEHINKERENSHLMDTIGSTGSGCGTANMDRIRRTLKLAKDYKELFPFLRDVSEELNTILDEGGKIIVEGSQATFLSLYHGTYPFVTSKDVTASACLSDVGLGPTRVDEVLVVFKSFVTRVGEGYLKNELPIEEIKERGWEEFGTVTSRLRRAAPFDFDLARKACRINGATGIALTKMDILFPAIKSAQSINALTEEALDFIRNVEEATGVPVKYISTGPDLQETIAL